MVTEIFHCLVHETGDGMPDRFINSHLLINPGKEDQIADGIQGITDHRRNPGILLIDGNLIFNEVKP